MQTLNTNKNGRWFKRYLDNETWSQVEKTYANSNVEKNWESLCATTVLFSRIAIEVARRLNYEYPFRLEKNITEYLEKIQKLERNASSF